MSPPSACRAGRMTSTAFITASFITLQSGSPTRDVQHGCVTPAFPCHAGGVTFAHQGGWDEALFVGIPLLLFGFLLTRAQRRAEREAATEAEPDQPAE